VNNVNCFQITHHQGVINQQKSDGFSKNRRILKVAEFSDFGTIHLKIGMIHLKINRKIESVAFDF
jgi:hypothetical protein